jgi:folate-dependent phosphoribosylglycinamide formyltransferase PurN
MTKQNITIFISGRGTNAINLVNYFKGHPTIKVSIIVSDRQNEEIRNFCCLNDTRFLQVDKTEASNTDFLISVCIKHEVRWVVLAGFLKKIPEVFIQHFNRKIINIHPSLLPKLRGPSPIKSAILSEDETGVTIMELDAEMDHGPIVSHRKVEISDWPPYAEDLENTLGKVGGEMLSEILPDWISGNLKGV